MDEYHILIQALLLKKNEECGKLCYLSSRITQENILYINGILDEIEVICKSMNLPIKETNLHENPKCINLYKYLSLNTNFKCLELLAQDNANTHLVDICPLISPYLFIEIVWHLHYEDILTESVLYVPLDFAVEIIEIARRCIDMLHFDRALKFLKGLIINSYKKLMLIKINGTQTTDININIDSFLINIQELITLFSTESFLNFEDFLEKDKYTRTGVVLKTILDILIACFKCQNETHIFSLKFEKYYKITFGFEPVHKCDDDQLNQLFNSFFKDMMSLLLKKIKSVDCNCYIEWVELDDTENPSITLQKAIGIRCYNVMELIRNDEKLKKEHEHLLECLQQISSKTDSEIKTMSLSLKDLISGLHDDKEECILELFRRCNIWDEKTFNEIKEKKFTVNKAICLNLLDYIVFLKSDPEKELFTRKVYLYTLSLMLQLEISVFVNVIISFIIKYDGSNIMENPNTENSFKVFIDQNPDLSIEKDYKQALLFMLKNVKKYVKLFIKVFLGHSIFRDTMLPMQSLVHFTPFLLIKDNENNYLVLAALRDILLENAVPLHSQVVDSMFKMILNYTVIKKHDLVNMVFTPYLLSNSYPQMYLTLVLHQLKYLWRGMNYSKVNLSNFFQGITKKLAHARKDTSDFRSNNCLIISNIKDFFEINPGRFEMRQDEKAAILMLVEPFLEPLDRWYFVITCLNWLLSPTQNYIIRDYERRFFCAKYKIMNSDKIPQDLKSHVANFGLLVEDFIRHAIIHSNSKEYISEGISIIKGDWRFLNWHNPLHSYTQFCRITMEACQLCLEYPKDFAVCTFPILLEFFANFVEEFQSIRIVMLTEEYCSTFVKGVTYLKESISGTPYDDTYRDMIIRLNNALASGGTDNYNVLSKLCQIVQQFSRTCLGLYDLKGHCYTFNKPHNATVTRFRLAYSIVNASMMITNTDITDCLMRAHQCLSTT